MYDIKWNPQKIVCFTSVFERTVVIFLRCQTRIGHYQPAGGCCSVVAVFSVQTLHLLAMNALRIWSQLPGSLSPSINPSSKLHNKTVYSWVCYCETNKVQYQKVWNCWVHDCKTSSAEHHMVNSSCTWYCKTRMVQGSCCLCLCKTVLFWPAHALRI